MSITVIIIDDERLARQRLQRLLSQIDGVQVIALGENGQQAVNLVQHHQPDLVFLDINMPLKDGLTAAKEIIEMQAQPPAIVFCTAYDQFAVEAFKTQAAAYLLKPVSQQDLRVAIAKAGRLSQLQISSLLDQQAPAVSVNVQQGELIVQRAATDFKYFRSEDKNVYGGLKDGSEVLVDYTLKMLQEKLAVEFVRVHRNSLLNVAALAALGRDDHGQASVTMQECTRVFPVSRRHLAGVRKCFR
nr:putative autolysis response regulater LytR (response regulator transcription factor) [uncultured bacterium]